MKRKFQLAENERPRFIAPVEIRWTAKNGTTCTSTGESVDASVYGLGVVVVKDIPVDTEVTVLVDGREICGTAKVRYSLQAAGRFRVGLQFSLTLVMQDIPGIDAALMGSLRPNSSKSR